jgi:hypothetical protein
MRWKLNLPRSGISTFQVYFLNYWIMKDIRIQLNVNEINLALKALGNLPYYQVAALIDKIQQQANHQLVQLNESAPALKEKAGEIISNQ